MGSVPMLTAVDRSRKVLAGRNDDELSWVKVAAGGTLIASGILLLAGQRRAALAAAASGTALALVDQQDTLRALWNQIPGYIDQAQTMIRKAQDAVSDVAVKRESLRSVLSGKGEARPSQPEPKAAEPAKPDEGAGPIPAKAAAPA
ncbi:MAG TPA: hypothetical protein VFI20_11835 [Terracidiphilus sp.]|nr:hypothetical protein [Terracidiphilus sp.]